MNHSRIGVSVLALSALIVAAVPANAALTVFSASGANASDIQATVDSFRAALGAINPNTVGSFGTGRREINWDGVPDLRADPNFLPANFFNSTSPRGVEFATPGGDGFLVSADSDNPTTTAPRFGFPTDFVPFSGQRLFAPVGSVITDVDFFIPGTTIASATNGFGVVFSDVEIANLTSLQAFGAGGTLLSTEFAPAAGNGGFSFLGVIDSDGDTIESVRITTGDNILISNGNFGNGTDSVVMDDFIYGEVGPVTVPETSSLLLVAGGVGAVAAFVVRRKR